MAVATEIRTIARETLEKSSVVFGPGDMTARSPEQMLFGTRYFRVSEAVSTPMLAIKFKMLILH